jgi:hypothetical protein
LNGKHTSKSVARLVDTFLPSLRALSKDWYVRATRPVLGNWIATVHAEAEAAGDDGLGDAACTLATHVFGTDEHRQAAARYRLFNREVLEEAHVRLEMLILEGIEDPDGRLTPFTRKAIGYAALVELDRRLEEDTELVSTLEALWELARDGGLTSEHREAIVHAHLSRGRELVPGILRRIVAEALDHRCAPARGPDPADWNLRHQAAFLNATKH